MLAYLILWLHMFSIHFGIWVTFCLTTTIMKNGVPTKDIKKTILATVVFAALISVFSSHSHTHIMKLIAPAIAKV